MWGGNGASGEVGIGLVIEKASEKVNKSVLLLTLLFKEDMF